MSSLLKSRWTEDFRGQSVLCVEKSRGKISLTELQAYLAHEARLCGHWIVVLNTNESACEIGWPEEEQKGDKIHLYEYIGEDTCPVCSKFAPPEYCPDCGMCLPQPQ